MKRTQLLQPLAIGALGAAVGASTFMLVDGTANRPLTPVAAYAGTEDDQQRIVEAVKRVEPSVVALDVDINGTRVVPQDPLAQMFDGEGSGGQLQPFHEQASGSGFVYSSQGLIVTNDHVVHGASKISVVFANGDRVAGHITAEDRAADLALVKVDHYAKLPAPVSFGSSHAVEQGEWAIAIGEPFALKQTVTVGVVSGFNRSETIGGDAGAPRQFTGLLQTSAPINPGNSGGPLVDLNGNVIGVNQSVAAPAQGIGFAIPADAVKSTVAMLAAHGTSAAQSSAGFLGVQLQGLDDATRSELGFQGEGAVVVSVIGGSPADQAGLQPGDVIEGIGGQPVRSPADVSAIVQRMAPGKIAGLRVWRAGNQALVAVHVGSQPDQSG